MKSISAEITVSGLKIAFHGVPLPENEVLVVAGGRVPDRSWLRKMAENRPLWAVDAGADVCMTASVLPELALGDFDGINPVTLDWLEKAMTPMRRYSCEKNKTDIQLCLEQGLACVPPVSMIVTGCFGGRFDHMWSLVNSVWRINQKGGFARVMADHMETLILLHGGEALSLEGEEFPSILSLLAFSERVEGVEIKGVRWPLEGETLHRNCPYSISNRPMGERPSVSVKLKSGWLGIYLAEKSAELKGPKDKKGSGP